ncbi:1772_t:CDS:1, partial [Paraglomus occultum]
MDSINSNDIHFYQPHSQAFIPSCAQFLNNYNNGFTDGNGSLNTVYYEDVGNSENRVDYSTVNDNLGNPFSVSYLTPQTLVQPPSSSSVFQTNYNLNNYREPSSRYSLPQTSSQTQSTSTNYGLNNYREPSIRYPLSQT